MLEERKLLCAFIIGAAESGACMNYMSHELKEQYINKLKEHIKIKKYGAKRTEWLELELEIFKHNKMLVSEIAKLAQTTEKEVVGKISDYAREYIYDTHLYVVRDKLKNYSNNLHALVESNKLMREIALSCPVMYYQVLGLHGESHKIFAENLFLPEIRKELKWFPGLERPEVGDIVSAHWNQMLEIIDITMFSESLKKLWAYLEEFGFNPMDVR